MNSARFKLHVSLQDYPEFEYHLAIESGKSPKPFLLVLMSSSGKHIYSQACFTCSTTLILL